MYYLEIILIGYQSNWSVYQLKRTVPIVRVPIVRVLCDRLPFAKYASFSIVCRSSSKAKAETFQRALDPINDFQNMVLCVMEMQRRHNARQAGQAGAGFRPPTNRISRPTSRFGIHRGWQFSVLAPYSAIIQHVKKIDILSTGKRHLIRVKKTGGSSSWRLDPIKLKECRFENLH